MDKHTYTNIQNAQAGDRDALEALTRENTPLIRSVTMRFTERGVEAEDLFQIGAIGFIKAVRGFDLTRGLALSTYAVPMIMGEIRRYLRDNGMIKVSRSIRETAQRAAAAMQILTEKTGGEVSISALSAYTGVPSEELAASFEATRAPDSLHRPLGDGDSLLMDVLPSGEDIAEKTADRVALSSLLQAGDATEKKVLLLRYFRDKTQSETARILGLSQVQVSRIEKKAITRLRRSLFPETGPSQ